MSAQEVEGQVDGIGHALDADPARVRPRSGRSNVSREHACAVACAILPASCEAHRRAAPCRQEQADAWPERKRWRRGVDLAPGTWPTGRRRRDAGACPSDRPGAVGRQDQRRTPGRRTRGLHTPALACSTSSATSPGRTQWRHRPRQASMSLVSGASCWQMVGGMVADDVDHRRARAPRVVHVGKAVGSPAPRCSSVAAGLSAIRRVAIGGAGHHALEQARARSASAACGRARRRTAFRTCRGWRSRRRPHWPAACRTAIGSVHRMLQ